MAIPLWTCLEPPEQTSAWIVTVIQPLNDTVYYEVPSNAPAFIGVVLLCTAALILSIMQSVDPTAAYLG
jgi:hypothetical protein